MQFDQPEEIDMICYQMRLADLPRSANRAKINELFNGVPPYTPEDVERNNIKVNVNWLRGTTLAHEARSTFTDAFLNVPRLFRCITDFGPIQKRAEYSEIVTQEINKIVRRSLPYLETVRSKVAQDILHGISPIVWRTPDDWCPEAIGVEDVMVPANTLLTMVNLPYFAIWRQFTGPELIRITRLKKNPGWNMDLVKRCLEWIDEQAMMLFGSNWTEIWNPEKASERVKCDGGFYAGDMVPTVNVWDFYFWDDSGRKSGWKRRMILDYWSTPDQPTSSVSSGQLTANNALDFGRNQFLYTSGDRLIARDRLNIIAFQFADLSAVAPFRYHSVRSLGFLLYAALQIENRLRCRFTEAIFENLMQYLRVRNIDEVEAAMKIELHNFGVIPDSVQFVTQGERFQCNPTLVELGLQDIDRLVTQHMTSWRPRTEYSGTGVEKTRLQVLAEMQSQTSLISSALTQAYNYQRFEYIEIFRRFCNSNSNNTDVKRFRAACAQRGVPLDLLKPEYWTIEPERVLGGGNRTLEMGIWQQLMAVRQLYDPEPQREILRGFTFAMTADPDRAEQLVPRTPHISDSRYEAQLAFGTLMAGGVLPLKSGINRRDIIEGLLTCAMAVVMRIDQTDRMGSKEEIFGLLNVLNHVRQHIDQLRQSKTEKAYVAQYDNIVRALTKQIDGFAHRLAEHLRAQGPGPDGQNEAVAKQLETMSKIQAQQTIAQAKAQIMRETHAQRTAQRHLQWQLEQQREEKEHQAKLRHEAEKAAIKLAEKRLSAVV